MDMCFWLAYTLSRRLYPDGVPCTGWSHTEHWKNGRVKHYRCRSNDHANERVADYRRGHKHGNGGYALSYTGRV